MQFFVDIYKTRRYLDPRVDGKAQSVGLSGFMIRILPEDQDLDFCKRCPVISSEYILLFRIYSVGGIFAVNEFIKLSVIRFCKLGRQRFQPVVIYHFTLSSPVFRFD